MPRDLKVLKIIVMPEPSFIHMTEYKQSDSGDSNVDETITRERNFVETEIHQTLYIDEAKRDQLLVKPLKERVDGNELHKTLRGWAHYLAQDKFQVKQQYTHTFAVWTGAKGKQKAEPGKGKD
uniref:Uncharacterized protein n=1 Tax=Glossina palpalis gambiensis TaxID=67801 RepID=A0A1B0BYG3_9MUSC